MRDVADQLIIIKSDLDKDHYEESVKFKQEFQALIRALFEITHGQDVECQARGLNPHAVGGQQGGPLLPVLALKPDRRTQVTRI